MKRPDTSLWSALLLALLLTACSDDEAQAPPEEAAAPGTAATSPLIDHVPANAAYVFANIEPMPQEVSDKMWQAAEPFFAFAQNQISRGIQELEARPELDEDQRLAKAFLEELDGKISREGLESLGLGGEFFAFYSQGVLPVARMQLVDGAALLAAIDRVESRAGTQFPERQSDEGVRYFDIGDDEVRLLLAVYPDQLVAAVSPSEETAHQMMLDQVLGRSLPETGVRDQLTALNAEYELMPTGSGYVDVRRLASLVLEDDSPLSATLFADHRAELSDVCRSELVSLADVTPRLVTGYTAMNADRMDQLVVLEMRQDLATELKAIALPMRGLKPSDEGAAYFAFGIDLMKLKQFAQARVTAMKAEPFQCELFDEFNQQLAQMEQQLAQPLPPFVGNFQGVRVMVDDVEFEGEEPGNVSAMAAIAMTNPQLMLGMAQAFVPQLAELKLTPDGSPVPLPDGLIPALVESPHVAMIQDGIGLSVGPGQEQKLQAFLDAEPPTGPAPIIAFSYDAQMLAAMQQRAMKSSMEQARHEQQDGEAPEGQEPSEEGAQEQADAREGKEAYLESMERELEQAMQGYYAVFDRVSGTVLLTDRGIEIRSSTTLE